MATHQANIDNLRTATLGEQVRGSMIQLFEEDYNLVKRGINVGTAVTSASSSTAGYYDGNLYINIVTLDVWECNGSVWTRQGNLKGIADITETISPVDGGVNTITITLTDGSTKVLTVKNGETGADGKDGVDGKSIANISLASTSGNVKTYDVLLDDGTKTPAGFSVEDGASSYLHIRYSSSFDGTGMVTTPTDSTVYIGILVSTSSVAPTNPSLYNWVRFIGKSGTGSGDMLATDYATKYPNTVDKAAALYDGTDEILANQLMKKSQYDADDDGVVDNAGHATNADNVGNADTSLLEKLTDSYGKLNYNGNALMLEAAQFANQAKLGEFVVNQISNNVKELALHSNITTKLSKVDTPDNLSVELAKKIDKPASATDGQILTYNGTSEKWEAKASQGSASNLVHLIITCDSSLAGATITATNGSEVKTATAPSGGGIVTINCNNLGTWNITENTHGISVSVNTTYYGNYSVNLEKNITVTFTVYSASNDTVYYKENGSNVTLCTTNANGQGSATLTISPRGQTLTLYSTVAKDTTAGTSAYSKTVTIDSSTTSIKVMPNGFIYWYGYIEEDFELYKSYCNPILIGGGITKNTNTITIKQNACVGKEVNPTGYSKFKFINSVLGINEYNITSTDYKYCVLASYPASNTLGIVSIALANSKNTSTSSKIGYTGDASSELYQTESTISAIWME